MEYRLQAIPRNFIAIFTLTHVGTAQKLMNESLISEIKKEVKFARAKPKSKDKRTALCSSHVHLPGRARTTPLPPLPPQERRLSWDAATGRRQGEGVLFFLYPHHTTRSVRRKNGKGCPTYGTVHCKECQLLLPHLLTACARNTAKLWAANLYATSPLRVCYTPSIEVSTWGLQANKRTNVKKLLKSSLFLRRKDQVNNV